MEKVGVEMRQNEAAHLVNGDQRGRRCRVWPSTLFRVVFMLTLIISFLFLVCIYVSPFKSNYILIHKDLFEILLRILFSNTKFSMKISFLQLIKSIFNYI